MIHQIILIIQQLKLLQILLGPHLHHANKIAAAMVQATTSHSLTFVPLFAVDHLILRQTKSSSSSSPSCGTTTTTTRIMVHTEQQMAAAGITLPPAATATVANYVPCQRSGNLLYLSGHLPLLEDGSLLTGKIGSNHQTVEYGYRAARQVGLNLIATLQKELDGDLDRVEQIVKLLGVVQSTDDFHEQHKVVNGCSDLMVQVFGSERGKHARSAIGTNALPLDLAVEIEAIVRVRD